VGEVTLPFGGTRRIAASDFHPVDDEELTLRGGDQVLRAQRVSAAFGLTLQQGNIGEGFALGYQHGSNRWQLALALGASRYQYDRDDHHVQRDALSLLAGIQYTELFSQANLRVSAGAAATLHRQELLTPRDRDRDQALGFGPYARVGLSVPLTPWLDFELALAGLATFFKQDGGPLAARDERVALDAAVLLTSGLGVVF
jgi:hypothetical protein